MIFPLLNKISENWTNFYHTINYRGGANNSHLGIFPIISELIKFKTGQEIWEHIMINAPNIEWAGALNCTYVPSEKHIDSIASLMSNIYSGVPNKRWNIQNHSYANYAANNILSISNDIPVIDFAREFSGAEINKLRKVIYGFSKHKASKREISLAAKSYNLIAKEYSSNQKKLNEWDITGFIVDFGLITSGVTFSSWLIFFMIRLLEKKFGKTGIGIEIIDLLESLKCDFKPDAVFVCRMKERIKNTSN